MGFHLLQSVIQENEFLLLCHNPETFLILIMPYLQNME